MTRSPQLGDLLASVGIINQQQLAQALQYQAEHGGLLGQALVRLGACSDEAIGRALEAQRGYTPLADRLAAIRGREAAVSPLAALDGREASLRYLQAFEREMRRVARDVKDVAYLLSSMGLQVEAARKTFVVNPEAAEQALNEVWENLRVIARELDFYATDLAPSALDEHDLLGALRQYAGHYRACYGGCLNLSVGSSNVRVSPQTALGLFRAIQCVLRAVGNSEGNRDVSVCLLVEDEQVVVALVFEPIRAAEGAAPNPAAEYEERILLLGGQVERQEEDASVTLICRVPVGALPPGPQAGGFVIT